MCLSNFKAIRQFKVPISWLRSYEKTSFRILRRGPGLTWTSHDLTGRRLLVRTRASGAAMRRKWIGAGPVAGGDTCPTSLAAAGPGAPFRPATGYWKETTTVGPAIQETLAVKDRNTYLTTRARYKNWRDKENYKNLSYFILSQWYLEFILFTGTYRRGTWLFVVRLSWTELSAVAWRRGAASARARLDPLATWRRTSTPSWPRGPGAIDWKKTWLHHQWTHFLHYWPFVQGIYWFPTDFPHKEPRNADLRCFLCCQSEQAVQQTIVLPVIWGMLALMERHCNGLEFSLFFEFVRFLCYFRLSFECEYEISDRLIGAF